MLLAVLTAKFQGTFRSETCSIHVTDKDVSSKKKSDVWEYCVTMIGIVPSTMDIQYSPNVIE